MTPAPNRRNSPAARRTYAIPALEKGLDVLELLSQSRRAIGLNEIAATLRRSRPELFRVVMCLSQRGYLLRDMAGNFRLSSKLLEVGSRHIAEQALIAQAMPAMEALAEQTGESCRLSILGEERLLVVAGAVGSAQTLLDIRVGTAIPLYDSVVGLVALAFASPSADEASWERRRRIQRAGGRVIEPELRNFERWRSRLAQIRRDGYLTAPSSTHSGSRVHAGPLLEAAGKLTAVLSVARVVAMREDRRRDASISEALAKCCRTISSDLGAVDRVEIVDGNHAPRRRRSGRNGKAAGRK